MGLSAAFCQWSSFIRWMGYACLVLADIFYYIILLKRGTFIFVVDIQFLIPKSLEPHDV